MKKIFMRAGALLMAAFVVMSAILLVSPVHVSAAEHNALPELPVVEFVSESTPRYVVRYDSSGGFYEVVFIDSALDVIFYESTTSSNYGKKLICMYRSGSESGYFSSYYFTPGVDEDWICINDCVEITGSTRFELFSHNYEQDQASSLPDQIVYSNFDIYFADWNSGSPVKDYVFFQQTPLVVMSPLEKVTLDLRDQGVLEQVLMGIVQMIPIGLVCLVGYKGLRKVLALLRGILLGA